MTFSINAAHLKHRLREIDAYNRNTFHRVFLSTHTDKMPVKWSAVHDINCGR